VAQVVEADEWQTGFLQERPEPVAHHRPLIDRIPDRIGKDKVVIVPRLSKRQSFLVNLCAMASQSVAD
jgi:hypothetical protein